MPVRPGFRTFLVGALATLAVVGRAVLLEDAAFVQALPNLWTVIAGFGAAYGASKVASGLRAKFEGEGVGASYQFVPPQPTAPEAPR